VAFKVIEAIICQSDKRDLKPHHREITEVGLGSMASWAIPKQGVLSPSREYSIVLLYNLFQCCPLSGRMVADPNHR